MSRKPEIKICQTNMIVLMSILEPNISSDEINVLIEPKSIIVEMSRYDVENPILAGILFGQVEVDHCRVRLKKDSVVIKLRKSVKGRWKSILEEATTVLAKPTPETRIPPRQGSGDRDPIEPSTYHDLPGSSEKSAISVDDYDIENQEDETIDVNSSNVFSTLETIKKFHQSLLGMFGRSYVVEEEEDGVDDDESRNEFDITEEPVVRPIALEP